MNKLDNLWYIYVYALQEKLKIITLFSNQSDAMPELSWRILTCVM